MTGIEHVPTVAALRDRLDAARAAGRPVGFVPTMGYLHDGHASLIRAARADLGPEAVVVTSIFVNPLQFAEGEDLDAYPRDLDGDSARAAAAGCDVLFVPDVAEMYPDAPPPGVDGLLATTVTVAGVSAGFEGASRPTHFAGVATVVAKLFAVVGPCRAYFGEKDYQQLAVVTRMARDLSLPVEVVGCETVREPDGLAMSSRNAYLTEDERAAAPVVHRALRTGAAVVLAGEDDPGAVVDAMAAVVATEPLGRLDYVAVVDAADLSVPDRLDRPGRDLRLLAAVRFGAARLIDNLGVTIPDPGPAAPTDKE